MIITTHTTTADYNFEDLRIYNLFAFNIYANHFKKDAECLHGQTLYAELSKPLSTSLKLVARPQVG